MFQFFGLAKTSWTKNIPTSLIFLFFNFFNQEKRHGHLATVKLDKQYPLLGDRIYFEFFEKKNLNRCSKLRMGERYLL